MPLRTATAPSHCARSRFGVLPSASLSVLEARSEGGGSGEGTIHMSGLCWDEYAACGRTSPGAAQSGSMARSNGAIGRAALLLYSVVLYRKRGLPAGASYPSSPVWKRSTARPSRTARREGMADCQQGRVSRRLTASERCVDFLLCLTGGRKALPVIGSVPTALLESPQQQPGRTRAYPQLPTCPAHRRADAHPSVASRGRVRHPRCRERYSGGQHGP